MDRIQPVVCDFKTEQELETFILACEEAFFAQVDNIADKILSCGKKFIALSGPTCSGKTTASDRICHAFLARGIRVKTVSIDDFYIDRNVLLERAKAAGNRSTLIRPQRSIWSFLPISCISCNKERLQKCRTTVSWRANVSATHLFAERMPITFCLKGFRRSIQMCLTSLARRT